MGAAVRLVTRVADEDWDSRYQDAFGDLGIPVMNFPARRTTTFRNTYRTGLPDDRYQDVEAVAEGFEVAQIESLHTEPCWWLLGPLTHDEIPSDVVHVMAERALGFAIDLQGYVRELHGTRVRLRRHVDARELIGLASVVKVDLNEAHVVTGERNALRAAETLRRMGADEVLVTLGSHGSLVAWSGGIAEIGAYSEGTGVHTTGCGDTYLASYLVSRLEGRDPRYSGALASVAAGLKTRSRGPLSCNRSELDRAAEECRSLWQ
jgi:sugar/nucleoside kinase (ribokinase family)